MANPVYPGPYYTAGNEHEFVLFRIGMRFNTFPTSPRALREAFGAMTRMPFMLVEQERDAAIGMLASKTYLSFPDIEIVQFWRSYEDLDRYASARERKHAPAWSWWNALEDKTGAVGIWHETFKISPGSYESIYGYMPRHGLAKATAHRQIGDGEARSRNRIKPGGKCPVAHAPAHADANADVTPA